MGTFCSRSSKVEEKTTRIVDPRSYLFGDRYRSSIKEKRHSSQWTSPASSKNFLFDRPLIYFQAMPKNLNSRCDQCGMIFGSSEALLKHKNRFCIGVKDSGIGRNPVYSDDEETSTKRHQLDRRNPLETSRRDQIFHHKQQRAARQIVNDIGDENRFDLIEKQDRTYREILLDYKRLKEQERHILREMFKLQSDKDSSTNATDRLKTQLDDLQRRNNRLEQERLIIQGKLEELISNNYQPSTPVDYDPYRFLNELKEHQQLNEKSVDFLRQRMIYPYNSLSDPSVVPPIPYPLNSTTRTTSDDVRDFRNTYLKAGGHNADVLARYSDIEYRLRAYEQYPWTKDPPEPLKSMRHPTNQTIDPIKEYKKLSDDENLRFQMDLEEIQEKFDKLDQRTRQIELQLKSNTTGLALDSHSIKTDFYPLSNVSNDFEPAERDRPVTRATDNQKLNATLDKRLTPRESPAMNLLMSNRLRDPLAPQMYDPTRGFVIFFDFILNLPRNVEFCLLVTCLHHPKSGLGDPSHLEPAKCQQYMDERTGEQMQMAMIAMKQPVPRCPPQQALTVVLEIQTSNKNANDLFKTEGWIKFPLFDQKNRVLSGRWKVPLKAPPVLHDESLAAIRTMPSFERVELHYRLVNAQDADEQSNATLSPANRDTYSYPIQYRK